MPISRELAAAVTSLHTFRVGDAVTVTDGSSVWEMVVSREARRSDGAYGSVESTYLTATFGPGRYSADVRAERVARGTQGIARR